MWTGTFRSSADLVLMLSWHENIDVYCNSECTSFNLVGSNPVVTWKTSSPFWASLAALP